jgi:hypothetical protein
MTTIKLAVVGGVVAEAMLYGGMTLFGHMGPCSVDAVAVAGILFHLLGIMVSELLFARSEAAASVFIIFSGAVQFFVIALLAISVWKPNER